MEFPSDSRGGGIGSENFVKIADGESLVGVFQGNPYRFRQHYFKAEKRSMVCSGESTFIVEDGKRLPICEGCQKGVKSNFRFQINFIVSENGVLLSKVFDQGWKVYLQLKTLHETDYNLEKYFVRITRTGREENTVYSIIPVAPPKGILTADQEKRMKAVKLHDLESLGKPKEDEKMYTDAQLEELNNNYGPTASSMNDIPF